MIYFVTSNKGKFAEAQGIFSELTQKDIGYTEIQADTLEEVAAYGIEEVTKRLRAPVMIEDAGLFVDALKGFPGVYSAYVQKTIGNQGILKLMEGAQNRKAFFKSVVAYAEPGMEPHMFQGEIHGHPFSEFASVSFAVEQPRGLSACAECVTANPPLAVHRSSAGSIRPTAYTASIVSSSGMGFA